MILPIRSSQLRKISLLPVLALLMATSPLAAQIVINEVDYDQPSTDTAEFLELKNTGLVAENLDAYTVELVNGTGGGAAVYDTIDLPNVNLAPGDYYVICANAATVANCDLDDGPNSNFIQNGAPDAIGLRQSGTLVDAVSYEGDTLAPYTEGTGAGLTDNSGIADSGISRCADGTDTNQNNADFAFTAISPGASNDCPGPTLVINEIDYDQPSTDAAEFVEIKNVGSSPVALGGIDLVLVNGASGLPYDTIALPAVSLAAGDYFVVCANAATVANCDLDDGPDTNFIQNGSPDAVALVQGGTIIDTVSYEGDTVAPYTEGSGSGLEDSSGSADMGISRCADGTDTDQNNIDLVYVGITPGATNDCGAGPGGDDLVINEIDYDQPGSDTAEFLEIKNVDTVAIDLDPFTIELVNGTGGGASVYQTIDLPSFSLAPGDYYVVCSNAATVFNCDLDIISSIQNGAPDAVAIVLGGTIIDTVSYEGDTGAPYTEGSGSGLEDPGSGGVGGGNDNKGISRFPDGVDTDANNVDLSTRCITPGAANSADAGNCALPGPLSLVVNEIDYDQPGSDFAEFVEIKNVGAGSASLAGVDLLLVNGFSGSPYGTFALPSVTLAAGDYYVVCTNAATVANCDLAVLSSIQNGAPDAVALRFDGAILDTVSYEGDTTGFTEGSGSGLADSGSAGQDNKGISRFPDGVDTDVNNVDLMFACITPGGANTDRTTDCSPTGPILEIWDIQGGGLSSPFENSLVTTADNVVTSLAPDGFFMQTPTSRTDGDIATSDGIFVFTGGAPTDDIGRPIAVGDAVDVAGPVQEFFGFTEIGFGSSISITGGLAIPAAVVFDDSVPSPDPMTPSCGPFEFECYEGMLIEITDGTVTGPNQRFNPDPIAEVHITAAAERTFREPGIEFPGIPSFPDWDGNPEVFELDPDKLGLPNQIIPAGSSFSATGVLGFEFGGYELWPNMLEVTPAPLPLPVRAREAGEMTVGTLNLFRLFDDVDDAPDGDRDDFVVSTAEYERRLAKFSEYIRTVLHAPDILAVQEVESIDVLRDLAALIETDDASVVYSAMLVEGNDIGTIDVGFLVRANITVDAITQVDPDETFFNPVSMEYDILHDRPPLLLEGSCELEFGSFPIAVMAVHNRSLGGIDGSEGERVRKKRLVQAESIANEVQNLQSADPDVRLVVIGDFNAFEFTDGYVDSIAIIAGDFDPAMNFVCSETTCMGDLVEPNLTNQVLGLDAGERYSFIFRGNAQVLDHALTSAKLADEISGVEYGRGNADAAVDLINDDGSVVAANKPLRSSDHDGLVVYISKDDDADGVPNDADVCPATVIPEGVPTKKLGTNRFALTNGDGLFDTKAPKGKGPRLSFTLGDTAGCSCEQIIEAQGLGSGHTKYGCSISAMQDWIWLVNP